MGKLTPKDLHGLGDSYRRLIGSKYFNSKYNASVFNVDINSNGIIHMKVRFNLNNNLIDIEKDLGAVALAAYIIGRIEVEEN